MSDKGLMLGSSHVRGTTSAAAGRGRIVTGVTPPFSRRALLRRVGMVVLLTLGLVASLEGYAFVPLASAALPPSCDGGTAPEVLSQRPRHISGW
jgi:hypothetical protein